MVPSDPSLRHSPAVDTLIASFARIATLDAGGCALVGASGEVVFATPEIRAWLAPGLPVEALTCLKTDDFSPYESREVATQRGAVILTALPLEDGMVFLCCQVKPDGDAQALAQIRRLLVHDLRVPLQALVAGQDTPDTMAETAKDALLRIDDILMLAEATDVQALICDFDPVQTVSDIVQLLTPLAAQRGIEISLIRPHHRATVRGAKALFQMLAQNLIGNAVQHGTAPEHIVLDMELCAPGQWQIRLEEWQKAGTLPHIVLETLVRGGEGSDSVPAVSNGTALMHAAGYLLGAKWALAAQDDQEALCASLILPEAASVNDNPAPEPDDISLSGRHILIVEDNSVIRDWSARILRQAGAAVSTAADGQAGLLIAENAQPKFDAILLDLVLPGLDGLSVARRLARNASRTRPKVIGFSAHDDQSGPLTGIDMMLRKPVSARLLRQSIATLLSDLNPTEAPMPQTPGDSPVALFNTAIVRELASDLGQAGARSFMERACAEARNTLEALYQSGFGAQTRAALHSSVGSCGITGLNRIEMSLRAIQDMGKAGKDLAPFYASLDRAISETQTALKEDGPPLSDMNQL